MVSICTIVLESNHVLKYWFSFYFVHFEYFCNTFLVLKNQEVQKSISQKKKCWGRH